MTTAVDVREGPILFSGEMVRALLDDRKTQTRRVVKLPRWIKERGGSLDEAWVDRGLGGGAYLKVPLHDDDSVQRVRSPYGGIRDRLWVRETFFDHGDYNGMPTPVEERIEYRAHMWDRLCEEKEAGGWSPSIHMPRWASRITLELTDVRVERVQAISEEDAIAEGVETAGADNSTHRAEFMRLWDSLNAKRGFSWRVNPWVWVLSFRRVTP